MIVKKISKIVALVGISTLIFTGCGNSERKETVQNIQQFSQEYEAAKESIKQEQLAKYQVLGESVQALLDISENNSGELETKEQIAKANELVEELRAELHELIGNVEESKEELETEATEGTVEAVIVFRNESQTGASSISIVNPASGTEEELDSFEAGKKVEVTVKLPMSDLKLTWHLYNENGECIVQEITALEDIKSGATIYYTDDGAYTEIY